MLAGLDSVAGELARPARRLDPPGRRLPRRGRQPWVICSTSTDMTRPSAAGARRRRVPAGRGVHAGLWLLEGLGQVAGHDAELIEGVRVLLQTFEQCAADDGSRSHRIPRRAAPRVADDASQTPVVRGAGYGALWTLGAGRPRSGPGGACGSSPTRAGWATSSPACSDCARPPSDRSA